MKIVLVMGTSAGGVGRHVTALAEGLHLRGHEVVLAAPPEELERFGIGELTGVGSIPLVVSNRPDPRRDVAARRDLRALTVDADIVDAHGLRAAALAALSTPNGVPLVATLHNAAPSTRVAGAIYALLERIVARRARIVGGVSTDMVQRMRHLGARHPRRAVVPAPPRRQPGRDRAQVRAALGLLTEDYLLVSVGRLAAQKDFGLLLDAVGQLRDLSVRTVIAGDGPERAALAARITAEGLPARLLGVRDDVPDLLAAADVVASSARWEGQPLWLQEALQVGAPMVVTDAGGTAETLAGAGLLVPVGDAAALADGIRMILTDPQCAAAQRLAACQAAETLPTVDDAVDAALASYVEAISMGDPPRRDGTGRG
ncbi:MAG: glycosyltransferase family 4 protein [Nostocoides sp.]